MSSDSLNGKKAGSGSGRRLAQPGETVRSGAQPGGTARNGAQPGEAARSRGLLWKEWRQLRSLRFVGLAIGLLSPLILIAGSYVLDDGLRTLGWERGTDAARMIGEVLPLLLALGFWPVWALVTGIQVFSADRLAGTETFLLERPVSRRRVWIVRLLAAAGELLLQIGVSLAAWLAASWLLTGVGISALLEHPVEGVALSGIVLFLCFASAVLVASLGLASFVALLVAGGLAAGILAAGLAMGTGFWHMRYSLIGPEVVLWAVAPLVLLAVSYALLCRGEPAGRRRLTRGVVTFAALAATVVLAFVTIAPAALERVALRGDTSGLDVSASLSGEAAFVSLGDAGRLVDIERAERLRYFPPPIGASDVAWSDDGSRLAAIVRGTRFGTYRARHRVVFVDRRGRRLKAPVVFGESEWVEALRWDGDRVVALVHVPDPGWTRVYLLRPGDQGRPRRLIELKDLAPAFAESPAPGRIVLVRTADRKELRRWDPHEVELFELDLGSGLLASEPVARETSLGNISWWYRSGVSPSGRYRVTRHPGPSDWIPDLALLDQEAGEVHPFGISGRTRYWTWWGGDRLARIDAGDEGEPGRLIVSMPGGDERVVARIRNGYFHPSPDGRRLLVLGRDILPAGGMAPLGSRLAVYELGTGAWTELPDDSLESWIEWAGPETLAITTPDGPVLMDLDGEMRPVRG